MKFSMTWQEKGDCLKEVSDRIQARIQDFKLGGGVQLNSKFVEVFRVKNHDLSKKKSYFFQF